MSELWKQLLHFRYKSQFVEFTHTDVQVKERPKNLKKEPTKEKLTKNEVKMNTHDAVHESASDTEVHVTNCDDVIVLDGDKINNNQVAKFDVEKFPDCDDDDSEEEGFDEEDFIVINTWTLSKTITGATPQDG